MSKPATIQAYGRTFPASLPAWKIELECYRYKLDTGLAPWQHLKNATQLLYPSEYRWSYWSDLIFRARCENDFLTIWGAGGTGKSTTCAIWDGMDWQADPKGTTTKIFTTSMEKQEFRHFGEVAKYHGMRPGVVAGIYKPTDQGIWYEDESGVYPKACIVAQSIRVDKQGNFAVAGNYGVHNIRNRAIFDEANATPAAGLKSTVNQSMGGEETKITLIGNPNDPEDLLCAHSMPETGSFDDLEPGVDEEWATYKNGARLGTCVHLDGLKSPRITHPDGEKLYPFLIGKKGVDFCRAMEGEDSHLWWQQVRGFLRASSRVTDRFFDGQVLRRSPHKIRPIMIGQPIYLAGLDPAWSTGGDRCILSLARLGYLADGRRVLVKDRTMRIAIKDTKKDPVSDQVARAVVPIALKYGCGEGDIGCDCTGTQAGIADVMQLNYHMVPFRVSFGGAATTAPISSFDLTPANEKYFNRVTQMWARGADSMKYQSVYGFDTEMSDETINELGSRKFTNQGKKMMLEDKVSMKARTGKSPDCADSWIVIDTMAREKYGWLPEQNLQMVKAPPNPFDDFLLRKEKAESNESMEESFASDVIL